MRPRVRHIRLAACGALRAGLLALALAAPLGAGAQAPSNPSLNAQLLVGARQGDLAQVERVLAAGASPSSRNRLGKTALLLAAEKGNLAIVEAMLKAGADVDQASIEGVTPLMAASYAGAAPVVKRLLAAGAKTDLVDRMNKPAMVYAAGQGSAAAIDALLALGHRRQRRLRAQPDRAHVGRRARARATPCSCCSSAARSATCATTAA